MASFLPETLFTYPNLIFSLSLMLSVISLWILPSSTLLLGGITCLLALIAQRMDWIGLISLGLMALLIREYYHNKPNQWRKWAIGFLVLVSVPFFYHHFVPGFYNLRLIDNLRLNVDSLPYRLYLNTDKILVGLMLLTFGSPQLSRGSQDWAASFRSLFVPFGLLVVGLLGSAFAFHYVRFDPKLPSILWLWAPVNLLFVCVAEEAFFRGFIQKELTKAFRFMKGGAWLALGVASFLFGCDHYFGGPIYMILSALAGIGYGYVYQKTGRLESSILLHFFVNLTHFIGFSYPALDHAIN